MKVTTSAGTFYSDIPGVLDGDWHMVTWMVSPAESQIYKIKDQSLLGEDSFYIGSGLNNTAYLNLGFSAAFTLDYFRYDRRVLPSEEYQSAWEIARGYQNGSAYPEAGHALGAHAEREGVAYHVTLPAPKALKLQAYADNFR